MSSKLCDNCQQRPKHFDKATGTTHAYCGKTCAGNAKVGSSRPSLGSSRPSGNNCENCKVRPKYQDPKTGVSHPYCGKKCAASMAASPKKTPAATSTVSSGASAIIPRSNSTAKSPGICKAPRCTAKAFTNTDGSAADYCSQGHRKIGETLCLMCRQAPKLATSHFCSPTCTTSAENGGPMILEVPKGHVTFKSIDDQFKTSWRHTGKPCPRVRRVYKIITPQASLASYNAYRASVEARGKFAAAGRSAGNENRRWHGTRRECNVGDKGHDSLCTSTSCPMCSIIRTSFDLSRWGSKTGWGRFGKGIYTSSTSSKSNDYASNDSPSKLKAILLNKVIVGKGCKMMQDSTSLTAPPTGYDSVLAEKGGSLNYDELVVYRDDAIRPSFLVLYEA